MNPKYDCQISLIPQKAEVIHDVVKNDHTSRQNEGKPFIIYIYIHILTLILHKIYTSIFDYEKQHYRSPYANHRKSVHHNIFRRKTMNASTPIFFHTKCTTRILQMHHQNPVVPPESVVHPQNPVCTYVKTQLLIHGNIVVECYVKEYGNVLSKVQCHHRKHCNHWIVFLCCTMIICPLLLLIIDTSS